jgi:chromosome segregation protein
MKLLQLRLQRYGHLSDVVLDFPPDALLHVVHGPNEAGKSTALSALADGLFGFPEQTPFDYRFTGPQLRVGFSLIRSDGMRGSFVRRKGRGNTLVDQDGQDVSDDRLRHFLGDAGRDLFERGFGLDGERLRRGGAELQDSAGEPGENLLAGTGLLGLRTALRRLDDEAKLLVGDGRGKRRLSEAVETWKRAQRAAEERAVQPKDWQRSDQDRQDAISRLKDIQTQLSDLAAESNRLQRIRRVAGTLLALRIERETYAKLADVPVLPPDAAEQHRKGLAAARDARGNAEREHKDADDLEISRKQLQLDPEIIAVQDPVDDLARRLAVVEEAEADLPTTRDEAAKHRAAVMVDLADLGSSIQPEDAHAAIPTARARQEVTRLINENAKLTAAHTAAETSLRDATRQRDDAADAMQGALEPPDPRLLKSTIEAVREVGPVEQELARAHAALGRAEDKVKRELSALTPWDKDEIALASCKLPPEAEAASVARRLERGDNALSKALEARQKIADERDEVQANILLLAGGQTVPTPAAVQASRDERDRAWRLIRRELEGLEPASKDERDGFPDQPLPEVFETLSDGADRLADRRADEAQRVAGYLAAQTRLTVLTEQHDQAELTVKAAEAEVEQARGAWLELWQPSGVIPLGPAAMLEWRMARAQVLKQVETRDIAADQHDLLVKRLRTAREELATVLPMPDAEETLAVALRRAATLCTQAEEAVQAHRDGMQALAREERALPRLTDDLRRAAEKLQEWRTQWANATSALGLDGSLDIDAAVQAMAAWERISRIVPVWQTNQRNIGRMEGYLNAFSDDTRAVQARLADPAVDEPPMVVVKRLTRRLTNARWAATAATGFDERIAKHRENEKAARGLLADAEGDLRALRELAGVDDDAALTAVIDRAGQRIKAGKSVEDLESSLQQQGDGLEEEALRAETADFVPDQAVARLTEIQAEITQLGNERDQASATQALEEKNLAAMEAGQDASDKLQEAEDALAEAVAAAEKYARLHVARVLLKAGIERFRRDQQGPMLRAAGDYFAQLTQGRYIRLSVEQDRAGQNFLVAVREDNEVCPMGALSEGARDQLYLSLRLANVGIYAERGEPLPFVADDLLVHFDDVRAQAALGLLARIGKTSQIILFTHHDHIAEMAAAQSGVSIQSLAADPVPV